MAEIWPDIIDSNEQFEQNDSIEDLQQSTLETVLTNEEIELKIKEDILITQFDEAVITKLINRNSIDNMTLQVFEINLSSRAPLFQILVQTAMQTHSKLSGDFGKYIAWLISLRQIIARQVGKSADELNVTAFLKNLLWIDISSGDIAVEDVIEHWDVTQCYCTVPMDAKKLLDESYRNCYGSLKSYWLVNVNIPSKAN